jgi:hypothetical protein
LNRLRVRCISDEYPARPSRDERSDAPVPQGYGGVTVRGLVHYLCSHDQQHLAGLSWLLGKMEAP